MKSWIRYAIVEFRHSFRGLSSGAGGGRDFLSMTAILVLLTTILSISFSLHRGLVINFADSLLGYTKNAGVPVRLVLGSSMFAVEGRVARVLGNFKNSSAIGGLEPDPVKDENGVVATKENQFPLSGFEFHPYLEVEKNGVFLLPEKAWVEKTDPAGFKGWAVSISSPLWNSIGIDSSNAHSTVIFSRKSMQQSFNRDAYERELKKVLPTPLFEDWKARNPESEERLNTIYLNIPFKIRERHFHEFDVKYVWSLPSVQRISFLISLELFKPLDHALRDRAFRFLPARDVNSLGPYVNWIYIENISELGKVNREKFENTFAGCMGLGDAELVKKQIEIQKYDTTFKFAPPVLESVVNRCLRRLNFETFSNLSKDVGRVKIPTLQYEEGTVSLKCADYLTGERGAGILKGCTDGKVETNIELFDDFRSGYAYSPERDKIVELVSTISKVKIDGLPALFIGEVYRNSVDKFRYLVSTLDYLAFPALIFFGAIAAYFLVISTGMFFSKRRINYGVLMARGMSSFEIRNIIFLQFALCGLLASGISLVALMLTKWLLNASFRSSDAYFLARDVLGIPNPSLVDTVFYGESGTWNFLPILSLQDIGAGFAIVVIFTVIILLIQMRILPITKKTYPIQLIAQN